MEKICNFVEKSYKNCDYLCVLKLQWLFLYSCYLVSRDLCPQLRSSLTPHGGQEEAQRHRVVVSHLHSSVAWGGYFPSWTFS